MLPPSSIHPIKQNGSLLSFVCTSAVRHQRAEGAIEQAIATADRWLSLDPLNEDIYLRLMQLHFSTGNRAAALKVYKTSLAVLMTELHAKPSAQMVALADFIRNASVGN